MPTLRDIQQKQITDTILRENIQESVNVQRYWSQDDATDEPTETLRRYRQISPFGQGTSASSLPQIIQLKMQQVALWMYQANPIAHRYIEQTKDFVLGDGITIDAEDKRVQDYLRAFWDHPLNKMDSRLPGTVIELGLYGEVLFGLSTMDNGILRVSYISPAWVDQVTPDPSDIAHFKTVTLQKASGSAPGIVSGDPVLKLLTVNDRGFRTGDAIFLAINRVADATRGISDLLPLMDVLGNLDSFMFNAVEKANDRMKWFWDITYEGATQEQLVEYGRQIQREGTYPGAHRLHNERVKWGLQSADLKSAETGDMYESIFSLIVTGLGIPPHWTGVGGGAIRAGAESSQEPSYKRLVSRQREVKLLLEDLCNYQIDQLILARRLPGRVNRRFTLNFPKIAIRDVQRLGGATNRIVASMIDAYKEGLYTKEETVTKLDSVFRSLEHVA